jgi:excisionase family DNA binding protein
MKMSMIELREYPEVMTIEQVAEYLQLHPQVVYRHVRAGTLPVSRIGRTIRFKKSALDRFLESGAWASAGKFMDFVQRGATSELEQAEPAARRVARFSTEID